MFTTAVATASPERKLDLIGQTVVVIGGSAGMGLETARRARAAGADVILTGRDPERVERAALQVGALATDVFDADDRTAVKRFFDGLSGPIDHVVVSAEGPHESVGEPIFLDVAGDAVATMRPGGTLLLMGDAASRPFAAVLAVALAPMRVRVELIAPGLAGTTPDAAALAVDVMANTTLPGTADDLVGGRQLLARAA